MNDAIDPIPQITRDDEAASSGDLIASNITRLRALFPAIVTDGKLDFTVLREMLGDAVEDGEERYGLNWKGKRKARAFALTPSLGTLLPAPQDSVDWNATQNILVEGDNLEALKLLRRSYGGKVKIIYIDPPYNTGNDLVYPDNYKSSIENYLSLTGQRGDKGALLTSDRDESGRLHTEWLNMVYPRLLLAKEMLRDDGFVFVSCDDGEANNLRGVLSEVFGEENLMADIIWKKSYGGGGKTKHIVIHHEHVMCFAENKNVIGRMELPADPEFRKYYKLRDDKFEKRGPFRLQPLATTSNDDRANLKYPIPYNGAEIWPEKQWQWNKDRTLEALANDDLYIIKNGDAWSVSYKQYLFNEDGSERGAKPTSILDGPYTQEGTSEISAMFGDPKVFAFPKPVDLIKNFVGYGHPENDFLVMDFFAGSGTTAQAVMSQNADDEGRRRYILVQLPERLENSSNSDRAGIFLDSIGKPRNIAELTKERLRRAGKQVREAHPNANIDTGFRVYKLATSNLKPWQPDAENLEASILDAVNNVMPGRTEDDLLVELLLKTGIDLTLLEEKRIISGQTVYALGGGALMVCLGDIGADDAEALGQGMANWVNDLDPVQTTVYFKDTGLGSDGSRAATKANLAAILRQRLGDRIAKIASI